MLQAAVSLRPRKTLQRILRALEYNREHPMMVSLDSLQKWQKMLTYIAPYKDY